MPPRPLAVRLLIPLLVLAGVPAYAQERPRLVIASESRDSILQALRIECDSLQLVFVSQNNKRALYKLDAGMMSVRQQMAPVTLEITFHLEDGKPGTRVVVSEELVASLSTGAQERRSPNPRDRAQTWEALLMRVKERVNHTTAPAQ